MSAMTTSGGLVASKSFAMTPTLEVIPDSVRDHNAGSCWACAGR